MASLQTTINFPSKKNSSSSSKKEKENVRICRKSTYKHALDSERSPLKNSSTNNCDFTTPVKRKSSGENPASSPPKSLKDDKSPSQLISSVSLNTPKSKRNSSGSGSSVRVSLFSKSPENVARKALHRGSVSSLPGREDKTEQLTSILLQSLEDHKSRSIYISGQPGTGKTASIIHVAELPKISSAYNTIYINCTGLKSSSAVFSTIGKKLGVRTGSSKSQKAYSTAIIKHLNSSKKMHLLILDEQDELVSKSQQVLYSLLEWVSLIPNGLVMVGIANCLDLIDRALPRLSSASFKPTLIHFSPYTAKQISDIILQRLQEGGEKTELFDDGALHLLASKVATVSGDVRRALDIASRVLQQADSKISISSVMDTFQCIYSTSETLNHSEDGLPLQQKIAVCSLMLLKSKSNKKDSLMGKLHDVYKKICDKKNIMALDMTEFISLLQLLETRGIIKLQGKIKNRMTKVILQWDEMEVHSVLKDKELLSSIIDDPSYV